MKGASRKTTLRSEILASIALLAVAGVILVGALVILVFQAENVQYRTEELQRVANLLSAGIQAWGGRGEKQDTALGDRALIFRASMDEGIYCLVADEKGNVVWKNLPPELENVMSRFLRDLTGHKRDRSEFVGEGGMWPFLGRRALVYASPLFASESGRFLGVLVLAMPMEGALEIIARRGWFLPLYVGLVVMIMIFLGTYLLSKNVLKPLARLMDVSEKIAEGQYQGLSWDGYPEHEVGRLAASIHSMATSLEEKQRALEEKIRELEKANQALLRAQEAMVRSEKLATIGRLAAGVAHEVGNPIGSILGYVDLLLEGAQEDLQKDCLLRVKGEAERIQRTIRTLVDVGRPSKRRWEKVDMKATVEEVLSILKGHPGMRGVELVWSPPHGDCGIWGDPDQVKQLLINLLLNAMDAVGQRGRVEVNLSWTERLPGDLDEAFPPRRKGDPEDKDFRPLRKTSLFGSGRGSGPFVRLEVKDTGKGIPPEEMSLIFEPFFTTKEPGKGTGLGLAVCLGIVESYGGKIQVQSEPGKGSSFAVFFPVGKEKEGSLGEEVDGGSEGKRERAPGEWKGGNQK